MEKDGIQVRVGLNDLVRPSVLFSAGVLQAFLPYLVWWMGGGTRILESYQIELNYEPVYNWLKVWLAFLVGCGLARALLGKRRQSHFQVDEKNIGLVIGFVALLAVVQLVFAALVLKGVPLFELMLGRSSIGDVNENITGGFPGQFGLLALTTFTLGGLVMLATVRYWADCTRRHRNASGLILAGMITAFSALFMGKTQGFVWFIVSIIAGACAANVDLTTKLSSSLKGVGSAVGRLMGFGCLCVVGFIVLHGLSREMRLNSHENTYQGGYLGKVFDYYAMPSINNMYQNEALEEGGSMFYLYRNLLPVQSRGEGGLDGVLPRAEPTSPSGAYAVILYSIGESGMAIFFAAVGFLMAMVFHKSRSSPGSFVVYAHCAWPLLSVHSYNHFLNLIFIPVPALVLFSIGMYVGRFSTPKVGLLRLSL